MTRRDHVDALDALDALNALVDELAESLRFARRVLVIELKHDAKMAASEAIRKGLEDNAREIFARIDSALSKLPHPADDDNVSGAVK